MDAQHELIMGTLVRTSRSCWDMSVQHPPICSFQFTHTMLTRSPSLITSVSLYKKLKFLPPTFSQLQRDSLTQGFS